MFTQKSLQELINNRKRREILDGPELDGTAPECQEALTNAYHAVLANGDIRTAATLRAILLQTVEPGLRHEGETLVESMNVVIFG